MSWRQRVRELEAENQFLREKIEQLERLLKSYENPHTPSSKKRKKNTERDENQPRFPGKPKGSNGGGIQLPPPDEFEKHELKACPDCDGKLHETGLRKQTVIDFPEKPIITTEHHILQYYCSACDKHVEARPSLPNGIYGRRLRSMVIMLKNLTNSHEKIASLMRDLGAPSFQKEMRTWIFYVEKATFMRMRLVFAKMAKTAGYGACLQRVLPFSLLK